jgi:hypothetical protein
MIFIKDSGKSQGCGDTGSVIVGIRENNKSIINISPLILMKFKDFLTNHTDFRIAFPMHFNVAAPN